MRDLVRQAIAKHHLAKPGEPLWVAVSGGVDSMVLLHVLRSLDHKCHVAHVDHGLRGAASDGDRTFLEQHCAENKIPFVVRRVDVRAAMESTGSSLQMAARDLRLDWFNELVKSGPSKMAMAHHADDGVETFFMGLIQGMGLHGWNTIPVRSGPFIRPQHGVGRDAILEYAKTYSIPWREDASNADTSYLRNRVRHELLPLLEQWRPGTHRNLRRNTLLSSELHGLAVRSFGTALQGLIPDESGTLRIPFKVITDTGAPFLFLHYVLRQRGFHPDQLSAMMDAMEMNSVGAMFIRGSCRVLVDRTELVVSTYEHLPPTWEFASVSDVPVEAPLSITRCSVDAMDLTLGCDVAWMDEDKVHFPLTLRPWANGDRMRPLGTGGSKLVSDILIDAKVPRDLKQQTYVLASGREIIWLCGHRLAEEVAVTKQTRRVLRMDRFGR